MSKPSTTHDEDFVPSSRTTRLDWRSTAIRLLLLLLPGFAVVVEHFASVTFLLLLLLSLPELLRRPYSLSRSEMGLFLLLFALVSAFAVSAASNGWSREQTAYLAVELRYLCFVPIYLMLRRRPAHASWLLLGLIGGGFVVAAQALLDVSVRGLDRATGYYNPNLFGPFAVLLGISAFVIGETVKQRGLKWLARLSFVCASTAALLSLSRTALIGLLVVLLMSALTRAKGYKMALVLGAVVFAIAGFQVSDRIVHRVQAGLAEFRQAVHRPEGTPTDGRLGPVGLRVEMWRASWLIVKANPLIGVGRGNYRDAAREYVDKGMLHPALLEHNHPHSAYLERVVSEGMIGLLLWLSFLAFVLILFVRAYPSSPTSALLGVVLLTEVIAISFSDSLASRNRVFISFFVVYLAALLSSPYSKTPADS